MTARGSEHPPGAEVARLRLPMPITGLQQTIKGLERLYGKGLTMSQEGSWWVIHTPGTPTPTATAAGGPVLEPGDGC